MPVSRRTLDEKRYAATRVIDKVVGYHREQERKLIPPHGTVGIGGSDFDHLLKATVGEAYLRVLRRGGTAQEAHQQATEDGRDCVKRWNEKTSKTRVYITGAYELRRWEKAGEVEADAVHLQFLSLLR